jgi:hypothetical protein
VRLIFEAWFSLFESLKNIVSLEEQLAFFVVWERYRLRASENMRAEEKEKLKKLRNGKLRYMHSQQNISKVKVKQSRNRPGVAQSVPGSLGSQISTTFGT